MFEAWQLPPGEHRVSVVEDDYIAPGPAAKRGRLVFGTARPLGGSAGPWLRFAFQPDSISAWSGIETHTTPS